MFDKSRIIKNKKLIYVTYEQFDFLKQLKKERNYHNLSEVIESLLKDFQPQFNKTFAIGSNLKQIAVSGDVWADLMQRKVMYQQTVSSIIQHYIEAIKTNNVG